MKKSKSKEYSVAHLLAAQTGRDLMGLAVAQDKKDENEERVRLLQAARADGVSIVHVKHYSNYGGITVAFAKSNKYRSGDMVTVAVQTCSRSDSFSKKVGTYLALCKFYDGKTIQLPLVGIYGRSNMANVVKNAFTALYDSAY